MRKRKYAFPCIPYRELRVLESRRVQKAEWASKGDRKRDDRSDRAGVCETECDFSVIKGLHMRLCDKGAVCEKVDVPLAGGMSSRVAPQE